MVMESTVRRYNDDTDIVCLNVLYKKKEEKDDDTEKCQGTGGA